jgi:threonine synthase
METSSMDTLNGLRCRECGRSGPAAPIHVCEFCFGPLDVAYRYEALAGRVTRDTIAAGPPSMWRYRDLLPIDGEVEVGRHAGFTPLVRARNLAAALDIREVWIKNDAVCHPTLSFKDRVVAVAIAKAKELGFDTVACASTGNLAHALAAHAAAARLAAYVFLPAGIDAAKVVGTRVYRPAVVTVDGTYDEVNRLCAEIGDRHRWAFVNVNFRPYYAEGAKTVGFEIAEQLGWRTPDHVVVPCAGGGLYTKVWSAFQELATLGLLDTPVRTRMHAAQAAGCRPIVTMVERDTDVLTPVRPNTIATSLAIGSPADAYYAYRTAKASHGSAADATDEEIVEAMLLLARTEGIFAEAAGGVTVAAAGKLRARGVIRGEDSVVICITGNGLKTPEVVDGRLDPIATIRPSLSDFERALGAMTSQARGAAGT